MLDIVLDELRNNRTIRENIDSIFLFSGIQELTLPTTSNPALFSEYLKLKKEIHGDGERATLLYCKYNQHIIASSNTKDIVPFCRTHSIAFITTLDIFAIAIHKGLITEPEADQLILKITSNNSFLCCKSIQEHLINHFDQEKYLY